MNYVVFTDMDGTLIDHHTYSCEAARPALDRLKKEGIPLIVCTSKTRAEIEKFRDELEISDPFISENGAAIFIPKGYFKTSFNFDEELDDYLVIIQGTPYQKLREVLKEIEASSGCKIRGFGDMTPQDISKDCGLDLESAELSKRRDFDEPFVIGDETRSLYILKEIQNMGLNFTRGGRYYHIMGNSDKGQAVSELIEIYRRELKNVTTIGLGDSLNDLPMLKSVDLPVLVKKPDGSYDSQINIEVMHAEGIGPVGWEKAIMEILE